LEAALGQDLYQQVMDQPLQSLTEDERERAVDELGRQALTEIYRQLLLAVITELWVDYLTQMEALRVSIGLEAYGQRDPLVQYKNRAFGLFQELLSNMRLGVVNRMFTYRPRDLSAVQTAVSRADGGRAESESADFDAKAGVGEADLPSDSVAEVAPVAGPVEGADTDNRDRAQEGGRARDGKRRRRRRH
jgi:preprotein translocase subunit SecA